MDYISVVTMLICIVFYIVGKTVYLPSQWCPTCKDHAFVGWAAQLIMWVAPKKNLPKCSANGKQCILLLVLTLVLSCLVDWMIELSISNKEQTRHIGYFTLYSFNTPSGASVAVEDPYAATTAWHLLLMLVTNLVTRCCGMAFHSSTRIGCRSANEVVC